MATKKNTESTGTRRKPFIYDPYTAEEISEPREGSKRAEVAKLLRRKNGATIEEIMDQIGWDKRTAREGVKLLHTHNGFGLSEDDKGRIRLIEPEAVTA